MSKQGRSSVVEQRPFKPKVVGSIPTAPTNKFRETKGFRDQPDALFSSDSHCSEKCREERPCRPKKFSPHDPAQLPV